MPIPLPASHHTVEKLNNRNRVTLPSKKSAVSILWFCVWLFGWGYMISAFLYLLGMVYRLFEIGKSAQSESQAGNSVLIPGIFLLVFFIGLLGMGAVVIFSFLRMIAGKEIVDVDSQSLILTRQIFGWKSSREYSAHDVINLRVNVRPSGFGPMGSIKKLLGLDGMITFDYGAKTFRFGLEIEEAEANQIILAIKEWLPQ